MTKIVTSRSAITKILSLSIGSLLIILAVLFLYFNPYSTPKDIRVTNVTGSSFTVSWKTTHPTKGTVVYSQKNNIGPLFLSMFSKNKAYDDRDLQRAQLDNAKKYDASESIVVEDATVKKQGKYYVHSVTVTNLEPETLYYFKVGNGFLYTSGTGSFAQDEFTMSSSNYIKTYKATDTIFTPNPTYGGLVFEDNPATTVSDGVLFMKVTKLDTVAVLSNTVNELGRWYIDLTSARQPDGTIINGFSEEIDNTTVFVEAGDYGQSEKVVVPMSEDAPASDILVSTKKTATESQYVTIVGQAYANKYCTELDEEKGCHQVGSNCVCPTTAPTTTTAPATTTAAATATTTQHNNNQNTSDVDAIAQTQTQETPAPTAVPSGTPTYAVVTTQSCPNNCTLVDTKCNCTIQGAEVTFTSEPIATTAPTPRTCAGTCANDNCSNGQTCGICNWDQCGCHSLTQNCGNINAGQTCSCEEKPGVTISPTSTKTGTPQAGTNAVCGASECQSNISGICYPDGALGCVIGSSSCANALRCCNGEWTSDSGKRANGCDYNPTPGGNATQCKSDEPNSATCTWYYCESEQQVYDKKGLSLRDVCNETQTSTVSTCHIFEYNSTNKIYSCIEVAVSGKCSDQTDEYDTVLDGRCPNAVPIIYVPTTPPPTTPVATTPPTNTAVTIDPSRRCTAICNPDEICILVSETSKCISANIVFCKGPDDTSSCSQNQSCQFDYPNFIWVCGEELTSIPTVCETNTCKGDTNRSCQIVDNKPVCTVITCNEETVGLLCGDGTKTCILTNAGGMGVGASYGCEGSTTPTPTATQTTTQAPVGCLEKSNNQIIAEGAKCLNNQKCVKHSGAGMSDTYLCDGGCYDTQILDIVRTYCETVSENNAELVKEVSGKICLDDGTTCKCDGIGKCKCNGEIKCNNTDNNVLGATTESTDADKTYTVSDKYVLTPNTDGSYKIQMPGNTTSSDVTLVGDQEYIFFIDKNSNGTLDSEEEVVDLSASSVKITYDDTKQVYNRTLKKGLNFVAFNNLPAETDSCKFIQELNINSTNLISQISRYDTPVFRITSYRKDAQTPVTGDCFPIVPGVGYIVKAFEDTSVTYSGYAITKPVAINFASTGWYLIGVNGSNTTYTAETLIDAVNTVKDLKADNVTRWKTETSRYDGLQKDSATDVYGFDYQISPESGYFMRIIQAPGIWTPSE